MTVERIAILGGGSAYIPGILYGLAHSGAALAGSEIVLMDIDPARLPMMSKLGQRMVAEAQSQLTISATTSLEQALEGATFVLTNFRPGGLEGLRLDEEIPAKYGLLGQETTGPGGTFFALRSVPQALALCEQMERICPDAWMINYLNPTNFIADAVRRHSKIKSLAICDGGGNGLRYSVPERLGLPKERVTVYAGGLNHHTWMLQCQVDGMDAYPRFHEQMLARQREDPQPREDLQFALWSMETLGLWPSDPGYLFPYYDYDRAWANARTGHSLYRMFMTDLPYHWPRFEAMAEGAMPIEMDPNRHHTNVKHGDLAVEMIIAIANNRTQVFHVNVPNDGCFTNIRPGAIVEVPALVDRRGVRPLCMGELPKCVVGLTEALINWQELSVDAALAGDRRLVLQAVAAHPWVRDTAKAAAMCDEMLAAHATFLPQFK